MISRRIVYRSSSIEWIGPSLPSRLRRLLVEALLEPVDLEPLPEQEETAGDLEDRAPRGARHGDDVGPVDKLVLERVAARELVRNTLLAQPNRVRFPLLPPRLGADLLDHGRQLPEGGPRLIDGLAEAEPRRPDEVPASGRLDEPIDAVHQIVLDPGVDLRRRGTPPRPTAARHPPRPGRSGTPGQPRPASLPSRRRAATRR